jgi:hypothetical protein
VPESQTIEVSRNGHANGYQNGLGSKNVFESEIEPVAAGQVPQQEPEPSASVTAQSRVKAATPDQPSPHAERKATPAPGNTSGSIRHKSDNNTGKAAKGSASPGVRYVRQSVLDQGLQRLESLSCGAEKGDSAALDTLRSEMDTCPHIWNPLVDLQRMIELKLTAMFAGTDPLRVEAFRKRNSEIRHELNGAGGSISTKMAASRLLACWQVAQFVELRFLESPMEGNGVKRLEQSQRRYESAMRTFVMSKRLDAQLQLAATQEG